MEPLRGPGLAAHRPRGRGPSVLGPASVEARRPRRGHARRLEQAASTRRRSLASRTVGSPDSADEGRPTDAALQGNGRSIRIVRTPRPQLPIAAASQLPTGRRSREGPALASSFVRLRPTLHPADCPGSAAEEPRIAWEALPGCGELSRRTDRVRRSEYAENGIARQGIDLFRERWMGSLTPASPARRPAGREGGRSTRRWRSPPRRCPGPRASARRRWPPCSRRRRR